MSGGRSRLALASLAAMLFCFLTSEVFAAGALLPLSRDLGVPTSQTGMLVTAYALVAAVTIIPMDAVTRGLPTRGLLVTAMLVLAVGHIVMGSASSFGWVVAARAATALFHGVVWASAPVVAARLMPEQPARATGAVFAGSSVANVLGAPLVAMVSDVADWRWASLALAGAALVCAVVLALTLPRGCHEVGPSPSRPDAESRWNVAGWSGLVILVAAAHLMAFTFVTEDALAAGLGAGWVPGLLLGMGAAGLVGTVLIGGLHDRFPFAATLTALLAMACGLALTALPSGVFVAGAFLWSTAYAALTVALQAFVLRDAPTWGRTASAWYVLAFQIGIASGAWAGGLVPEGASAFRALGPALLALVAALLYAVVPRRPLAGSPDHGENGGTFPDR